jgi:uncharacterized membrane protein (DUF485 family)
MESVNAEFERQNAMKPNSSSSSLLEQTQELARTRNRFVWTLLYVSLGIYFALLVIVLEFPDVMSLSVYGEINLGLLAIVVQFALTIATFWGYCSWAERVYDPQASDLLRKALVTSNGDRHE